MLNRLAIVSGSIMLTNLVSMGYAAEDIFIETDAKVKVAYENSEIFAMFVKKSCLQEADSNIEKDFRDEDALIFRCLRYLNDAVQTISDNIKNEYNVDYRQYCHELSKFVKKKKDVSSEFYDELLEIILNNPDFLFIQKLIPVEDPSKQDFIHLQRRFLSEILQGNKIAIIKEEKKYFKKSSQRRLEKINHILTLYRKYFKDSRKHSKLGSIMLASMKEGEHWCPKTRNESLLAREIMYSLLELVRAGHIDLELPIKNARSYCKPKSRFSFAVEENYSFPWTANEIKDFWPCCNEVSLRL